MAEKKSERILKKQAEKTSLSSITEDVDGILSYHIDYPEFRCQIVSANEFNARVKVVSGWLGYPIPNQPVTIPLAKLEMV